MFPFCFYNSLLTSLFYISLRFFFFLHYYWEEHEYSPSLPEKMTVELLQLNT